MNRALWRLIWLRFRGWCRRLQRSLSSIKGILICLVGLLLFCSWLPAMLIAPIPDADYVDKVRIYGPVVLLAFCLVNLLFSTEEWSISFTSPEVNFLFPAPLSRRQLLIYKIVSTFLVALLSGLILAVVVRRHTTGLLQAFVATSLGLLFLQLLMMALALIGISIGVHAWNRKRRIFLFLLLGLSVGVSLWRGMDLLQEGWLAALDNFLAQPFAQVLLFPFQALVNTATAEVLWPDLILWSLVSLGINGALLLLILLLDAHYLEASAAVSERLYQKMQQVRRGGVGSISWRTPSKIRFSLPALPNWGGIGPLLHRQLLIALRNPYWLFVLLVFSTMVTAPMFLNRGQDMDAGQGVLILLLVLFVSMWFFIPMVLTFDFRGDLDRMEVLKSLPIPAWRLVVGQIIAPVLVVVLVQSMLVLLIQVLVETSFPLWCFIPFLVPINFLIFGVENLMFLWFPTRHLGAGPGDFQTMGRHALSWMLKMLILGVIMVASGLAGALAYFLFGQSIIAALVAAWFPLTIVALGQIPLLCLAFDQFDVSRDMPPP